MPIRKHKKFSKPRKPFDKPRIEQENAIVEKYGLKSKREIWKADTAIEKIRKQAKLLLTKDETKQEQFIQKLHEQGFKVKKIADVLALKKEDYLERRLQTLVFKRGLAHTPKQARQFIAHKHIAIDNKKINVPSYLVPVDEEDKISLKLELPVKLEKTQVKSQIEKDFEEINVADEREGTENAEEN